MRDVIVTGAASGIGEAIAVKVAEAGDRVWCLDRDVPRLSKVVKQIQDGGGTAQSVKLDVTDERAVAETIREIGIAVGGQLDGLVNSAGMVRASRFDELSAEDWLATFSVNVIGTFLMIKASAPLLRPRAGAIVNISSMSAKLAGPFTAPYNASKAAVVSLTRTAAAFLAPAIRVNCVCPGVVDTPMYEGLDRGLAGLGAPDAVRYAQRSRQAPLQRPAQAAEIAAVVIFLLGPGASYITGEDVNVSGGFVMH